MHRRPTKALAHSLFGSSLVAVGWCGGTASGQTTQTFFFDSSIDLGTELEALGETEAWVYDDLSLDWDNTNFALGGIVGKSNTVIIPEVSAFGKVIIPEVKADTRTGARFTGTLNGGTGLVFYADFDASGLEDGAAFNFNPTIDVPDIARVGEFNSFSTSAGLIANQTFDTADVDLPSFEAGMDFFFDFQLDANLQYGLFPVVKYDTVSFSTPDISVNQSLLKFEFDLDPDSNPDSPAGIPPTFTILEGTPVETQIGVLDDSASVVNKQISIDGSVPGTRLDIGEVQLVNPFGVDNTGIAGTGTETNLKIETDVSDDKISYTAESALLRLGLDLDGIAGYLATGTSFTRIEEEIGGKDNVEGDGFAEIVADLIDLKYGPEIGYRESVEIDPNFQVRLNFTHTGDGTAADVKLRDGSTVSLVNTWTGAWSDIPEIALIQELDVDVNVEFLQVTGEQTKKSSFYLTDYLELTLFELEDLTVLDAFSFSLPALVRQRTSLLGNLLGEFELDIYNDTEAFTPFDVSSNLLGTTFFTLNAAPSEAVYLTSNTATLDTPASWLGLSNGQPATDLTGKSLFLAVDDPNDGVAPDTTADLAPVTIATNNVNLTAAQITIPTSSSLTLFASSINTSTFTNHGQFLLGNGSSIGDGFTLNFHGTGTTTLENSLTVNANTLVNNQGHTLKLDTLSDSTSAPGVSQLNTLINHGVLDLYRTDEVGRLDRTTQITNTGTIGVYEGAGSQI